MTASARLAATSSAAPPPGRPATLPLAEDSTLERELAVDSGLRALARQAKRDRLSSGAFVARVMAALPPAPPPRRPPWWRRLVAGLKVRR